MKLSKSNTAAIKKVLCTIERFERYKGELKKIINALSGKSDKKHLGRPHYLLLTHFTNPENAIGIIDDHLLKPNPNKGYISFSAASPLEFDSVISSTRKYGFSFFVDDLINAGYDLYSPITFIKKEGIIAEIENSNISNPKRLWLEPTGSQESGRFLNLLEVRATVDVPLSLCSLFFREKPINSLHSNILNDEGIFQLPYTVDWFISHFIDSQKWYFNDNGNEIEFFDNRVCKHSSQELITKLKTLSIEPTPMEDVS